MNRFSLQVKYIGLCHTAEDTEDSIADQDSIPLPPSMMEAFALMLSKSLALNAAQIPSSIHADLQEIGMRMDTIDKKADKSVAGGGF